jgi:phage-related minor tail protein
MKSMRETMESLKKTNEEMKAKIDEMEKKAQDTKKFDEMKSTLTEIVEQKIKELPLQNKALTNQEPVNDKPFTFSDACGKGKKK